MVYRSLQSNEQSSLCCNSRSFLCSVAQSCLILCGPIDCGLPGSSPHGVFQAKILEWIPVPYSRGSSRPEDQIRVSGISCIGRQILYHQCHLEAQVLIDHRILYTIVRLPWWSDGKESACMQCWRPGFSPQVGKIPWRRKWHPTPDSCLKNPMDGGAWQATVRGVARSRTRLSDFTHFQCVYVNPNLSIYSLTPW